MSLAIVLGSGGHTGELIKILNNLPKRHQNLSQQVFCASDDTLSVSNWRKSVSESNDDNSNSFTIHKIPRARHVGQSFFTSIFTTIYSFLFTLFIFTRNYPKVIICNGPAISVSITMASHCIHILSLRSVPRAKIVYVESVARVEKLSLSGKIMVYIADNVLIQWPQLYEKYKNRKNVTYSGLVV